jgi:hypothetical protein
MCMLEKKIEASAVYKSKKFNAKGFPWKNHKIFPNFVPSFNNY